MELTQITTPAVAEKTKWQGATEFEVSFGRYLVIETSPGGAEILEYTIPANGATVNISLTITEH